jgi:hypothetical protein
MFHLVRNKDVSGVSGIGVVAEGVVFRDGTTVIRWLSIEHPSTNIYSSIEDVFKIHGHEGSTVIDFQS